MEEELYGVAVGRGNYGGRNQDGTVRRVIEGQGTFMSRECAEKLCGILKRDYPLARIIKLYRGDHDEIPAQTLEELGERAGLDKLALVVQQCVLQGFHAEEITAKCQSTIAEAAAEFAKEQRIHELEAETRRLKML